MSGTMRLSILIEAIDRASRPFASLQARMARVAAGALAVGAAAQRLGAVSGASVLAATIGGVATRAREASSAIASLAGRAALLGAGGVYAFNRVFIRGAADFQRYQLTLETVMGSAEAARQRLAELNTFAENTPFNVGEVFQAGVALQTLGIRGEAANRALTAIGDAAAVFGTRLPEAMTAFSAAMRGEMDPLERFGVQARTEGNSIILQWEQNGARLRAVVDKNNRAQLAAVLTRAMGGPSAGGMQKLARSWDGMLSNLGDAFSNFTRAVAEAGPFQWLQEQLGQLLELIGRLKADGTLARWAQEMGEAITTAFRAVRDFLVGTEDTPGLFVRLRDIFRSVWEWVGPLVRWIGGLETTLLLLALTVGGPVVTSLVALTGAIAAFGAALLLTPVGWFLLGAAAIAGVVYLIYRNWGRIAGFFQRVWDGIKAVWNSEQVRWLRDTIGTAIAGAASLIMEAWEGLESGFRAIWNGIASAFTAGWAIVEPIVTMVVRGARALADLLPEGSGTNPAFSPEAQAARRERGGSAGRARAAAGMYSPAILAQIAAAEGGGITPPANDVRLSAGLDVVIRAPEGFGASVTQRGADDGLQLNVRRGLMAVP